MPSAKCLPWSARRLRTFLVPQHLTLPFLRPPTLPPTSPCFAACFCWRFLPPNFGAVTFFSALSLFHTAQPVPVPVPSNVLRCPLLFVHYCCCLFFLPCTCWLLFYAHRFSLSAFYRICRTSHGRTDRRTVGGTEPVSPCVAVCLPVACLCAVTGQEVFKATFNVVSRRLRLPRSA